MHIVEETWFINENGLTYVAFSATFQTFLLDFKT